MKYFSSSYQRDSQRLKKENKKIIEESNKTVKKKIKELMMNTLIGYSAQ